MNKPLIPPDILLWIENIGENARERVNMVAECAIKGERAFRYKMRQEAVNDSSSTK